MATIYKSIPNSTINSRNTTPVDASTKTNINTTLNNFVSYFKAKHLS